MDYFQVLGVPKGATHAEVKMAYDDLKQKFDPHRVSRESPLWKQVVEISSVLEDAYRLLANPVVAPAMNRPLPMRISMTIRTILTWPNESCATWQSLSFTSTMNEDMVSDMFENV